MAEESKLTEKLEEKETETKFTEEEMNKIKDVQRSYYEVQQTIGQIGFTRLRLEQQLDELDKVEEETRQKLSDTQQSEIEFNDTVSKKYGHGSLNPETGVFTLNKVE